MKTEKISNIILWVLMGLSALVFLAFYIVGFGETVNDAPVTVNILILWCLLLVCLAFVAWVVSRIIFLMKNGINPLNVIVTWGLPILFCVPGLLFGLANRHDPIEINGKVENVYYKLTEGGVTTDVLNVDRSGDILISEIVIWAVLLMIIASLGAIVFSFIKGLTK